MATKYGSLFLCIIICVIVLFISYLCFSAYTLRKSQEEIKKCYSAHIQKADSLYVNLIRYSLESMNSAQHVNGALLADSLIKQSLGSNKHLSEDQFKVLLATITQHYNEVLKMHDRNGVKLQKDSLFLSAERILLEGQTKNMIDLHLSKIEHEYSNITMWAAILTVIFLVFSFYSIFKMDELIKQGDEGVKEIKKLKREGDNAVNLFKTNSQIEIEALKTKSNEEFERSSQAALGAAASLNKKITEIEALNKNSLDNIEVTKKAFEDKSKDTIKAFEESLNKMSENVQKDITEKIEEFNSLVLRTSEILKNLQNQHPEENNGKEGQTNG